MDWIDEKISRLLKYIRNLSFRQAMIAYILVLAGIVWILSYVTKAFCAYQNLPLIGGWCSYVYAFAGMIITIFIFYHKRLKIPLSLLEKSVERIRRNDLDFHVSYESRDELGRLCDSVENMRLELVKGKEELWRLVERQKELNAAFAHDLRTPLTVLRGYTDFLARYTSEGKLSQQKVTETLLLMSEHLKRLEDYSRTMKGVRSIEELPFSPEPTSLHSIEKRIREILFALNQTGGIPIAYRGFDSDAQISVDNSLITEVLENALSNAIRYAKSQIFVRTDYDAETSEILLTVQDDGIGFTDEQLHFALKPYYKEYEGNADNEHFGIGLHICLSLCRKHNGTLSVANSILGGAIVSATFRSCTAATPNI